MILMFSNFFGMFATLFNAGNNLALSVENLSVIAVSITDDMAAKAKSDGVRNLLKYRAKEALASAPATA